MDNEFQRPTCKKSKLWSAVARKLEETGGYGVSGSDCDEKWRNLQATYKRNKDKKGTSGHKAVTWEYYELMDEVLGSKASIQPSSAQLFSSLPSLITSHPQSSQVTDPPNVTVTEPEPQPCSSSQPVASKRRAKYSDWIDVYSQQQEKRMKMWEEQKALEEKKIDAINNLAAAIARLADRPEQ